MSIKIADKEIKLAILDLDGTLIDSTGIWFDIDKNFFGRRGMEVPFEYSKHIAHIGLKEAAIYTHEHYGIKDSPEDILKEWNESCKDQYLKHIPLKEGAIELLEYLKKNNVVMAVATANSETLYVPLLKRLKIYDYFSYFTDVNKAEMGKNDIKFFNDVCEHLNVQISNTMVLDDQYACLKNVHSNGYYTIGVYDKSSHISKEEILESTDIYIYSLLELVK